MLFKNHLTFTCSPGVQPGPSSVKGQQSSIGAGGTRSVLIRAQKPPSQCAAPINVGEGAAVVCQKQVKKNQFPIEFLI